MYTPGRSGSIFAFSQSCCFVMYLPRFAQMRQKQSGVPPPHGCRTPPFLLTFRSFAEAGIHQLGQAFHGRLLVCAVRNDADGGAAYDAQAQNAKQAFRIDAALFFSTQMEDLNSFAFWMKKVAGRACNPTWFSTVTSFTNIFKRSF